MLTPNRQLRLNLNRAQSLANWTSSVQLHFGISFDFHIESQVWLPTLESRDSIRQICSHLQAHRLPQLAEATLNFGSWLPSYTRMIFSCNLSGSFVDWKAKVLALIQLLFLPTSLSITHSSSNSSPFLYSYHVQLSCRSLPSVSLFFKFYFILNCNISVCIISSSPPSSSIQKLWKNIFQTPPKSIDPRITAFIHLYLTYLMNSVPGAQVRAYPSHLALRLAEMSTSPQRFTELTSRNEILAPFVHLFQLIPRKYFSVEAVRWASRSVFQRPTISHQDEVRLTQDQLHNTDSRDLTFKAVYHRHTVQDSFPFRSFNEHEEYRRALESSRVANSDFRRNGFHGPFPIGPTPPPQHSHLFILRLLPSYATMDSSARNTVQCIMSDATFNMTMHSAVLVTFFWHVTSDGFTLPMAFLIHNSKSSRYQYLAYRALFSSFPNAVQVVIDKDRAVISALHRLNRVPFICRAHNHRNIDRSTIYPETVKALLLRLLFVDRSSTYRSIVQNIEALSSHLPSPTNTLIPYVSELRSDSEDDSANDEPSDDESNAILGNHGVAGPSLFDHIQHHWLSPYFHISPSRTSSSGSWLAVTTCAAEGYHRALKSRLRMVCGSLHQREDGSLITSSANLKSLYLYQLIDPLVHELREINLRYYFLRSPVSRQITMAHISKSQLASIWPLLNIRLLSVGVAGTRYTIGIRDTDESVMVIPDPSTTRPLLYACTCSSSNSGRICEHILGVLVFQAQSEHESSSESCEDPDEEDNQTETGIQEPLDYVHIGFTQSLRLKFQRGFYVFSD